MQISEFSRAAGLPPDTVRFYVKRGLLKPETGMRGGSNPYQIFTPDHVEAAKLIRLAQSLGFTLREISTLADELGAKGMTRKRKIAILRERLEALEEKAARLQRMAGYLRAKIRWMEGGEAGPVPLLDGEPDACAAVEGTGVSAGRQRRSRTPSAPVAAARQVRHI